jgi:hypothetical protein
VSSETDYDFLTFYVDGSQQGSRLSGNSGWVQRTYAVPAGQHTLRWEYSKDGSVSRNQDMAWVDEFSFTGMDTDGDGMDDQWEIANFGNLAQTAEGDFDGDGQPNGSEELAMTDPTDSSSRLEITDAQRVNDSTLDLTWDTASGLTYTIEGSTDLTNWTPILTGVPGSGGAVTRSAETGIGKGVSLIAENSTAYALVPSDNSLGTTWRGGDEAAFAAAGGITGWLTGPMAVGYEGSLAGIDYGDYIGIDTLSLQRSINATVYVRVPFNVADPATVTALTLGMRVDDGYVAFINGVQVASDNNPASPTWNSTANASTSDATAIVFADTDITASTGALVAGQNILAIHGLNRSSTSSDMLIGARLTADVSAAAPERYYWRVSVEE